MRSGTIALLLGILWVQQMPALQDEYLVQFLPITLFIGIFSRFFRLPALFLSGFLWATFCAHLAVAEILPADLDGAEVVVDGRITGVPLSTVRRTRFEFQVETLSALENHQAPVHSRPPPRFQGKARLSWYGAPELRAGERWRLRVRLRAPRGYANPGGFDYERWLFARGVRATGYVRATGAARRLDGGGEFNLHGWRQGVADQIISLLPGRDLAGVIAALAVGVRGNIDEHQWRVFRDTGTAHLMAISGLHVGLVAALAFILTRLVWSCCFRACLWVPAQRAAAMAGLAAGWVYAGMAGFSLPTQRAAIMLTVVMWCLSRHRATAFSVSLCAALAAVIIMDPFSVLSPSLWLSFAAVAVLAFATLHRDGVRAEGLRGVWWRWGRPQYFATLGLAPILLATFGQQPLLSPLANMLAIPWMAFLVVPGSIVGALLASVWPPAGAFVLSTTATLLEVLWPSLEALASLGYTLELISPLSFFSILAAAVGVVLLTLPREVPGRWLGVFWMAPLIGLAPPAPPAGTLWFSVLDVGHGLAAVVRTRGHTLVFDAGPSYPGGFDAGSNIVAPFLRGQGVRYIDKVLISHPDTDHSGGLRGLLAEVPAGEIIGPPSSGSSRPCVAGIAWSWDGYEFRLMHPGEGHHFDGNDASCVMHISGPGGSILVAADIEAPAERQLTADLGDALSSTVLVAPHHGSRSSSTAAFVHAVGPKYVLFSASRRRVPRLPDPSVVERYRAAGARILNTAERGALSVVLQGGAAPEVSAFRQQTARYWRSSAGDAAQFAASR